jgi:peroxiredoxin
MATNSLFLNDRSSRAAAFLLMLLCALVPAASRKPAPRFDLVDETGRRKRLSSYRGKVVLLNFWATSCGGCILEIPSFIAVESTYGPKGFTAVGVAMDIPYDNLKNADQAWQKVRPFIRSHKVNYPILMGGQPILKEYRLTAFPDTYLIDKSGRVAAVYVGVVNKDAANIQALLSE